MVVFCWKERVSNDYSSSSSSSSSGTEGAGDLLGVFHLTDPRGSSRSVVSRYVVKIESHTALLTDWPMAGKEEVCGCCVPRYVDHARCIPYRFDPNRPFYAYKYSPPRYQKNEEWDQSYVSLSVSLRLHGALFPHWLTLNGFSGASVADIDYGRSTAINPI